MAGNGTATLSMGDPSWPRSPIGSLYSSPRRADKQRVRANSTRTRRHRYTARDQTAPRSTSYNERRSAERDIQATTERQDEN